MSCISTLSSYKLVLELFPARVFLAVTCDSLRDFLCACRLWHSHRVSFVFTSSAYSVIGLELRPVLLVLVSVPCCLLDLVTVSDCIRQRILVD